MDAPWSEGLLSFNISSANEKAAVSGASGAKHVGDTKDVVKERCRCELAKVNFGW